MNLKKEMDNLVSNKLAIKKTEDNLIIYKYSKSVFFKNLWNVNKFLLKARGIVLDNDGNIVQHTFDKIFNFNENGTGSDLKNEDKVIIVEKLNGFLGCITKHPNKNELLVTTTGSFNSEFVDMINSLINDDLKNRLLDYLSKNNKTLMFEVIHENDPHIISYKKEEQGLWLIGARGKEYNALTEKENVLDNIAKELKLPRPYWYETTFGDMLNKIKNIEIEGFMVLDVDNHQAILKAKSNYYLTTKFIGRMGNNNIEMMYNNTKVFKQKIDEEFYELVDVLISKYDKNYLMELDNDIKVNLVKDIISDLNKARNYNSNVNNRVKV